MDRDTDGGYRMTFASPGAPARTAKVVRVVGSRRYQQYLAAEGDTLWRLPVAYHIEEKRWFPMTGAFLFSDDTGPSTMPPGPRYGGGVFDRHVTRWNDNCVFCHNVAPNPGLDPASGRFRHRGRRAGRRLRGVPRARRGARGAQRRSPAPLRAAPRAAAPTPPSSTPRACRRRAQRCVRALPRAAHHRATSRLSSRTAIRSCRATISRATVDSARARHALQSDATAVRGALLGGRQPRLTAYEYQGYLQSACAQRGRAHLRRAATACTRAIRAGSCGPTCSGDRACHALPRRAGFAAPAAAHARHEDALRCVDCHMPEIVYGLVSRAPQPSHRSARPGAQARDRGRDACTLCHVDGVGGRGAAGGMGRGRPPPAPSGRDASRRDAVGGRMRSGARR